MDTPTATKYAYQALMEEHKLTLTELPNDAKIGIDSIYQIEKAITMMEKKGKKIKPATYDKVKANDKWVVREILDYVEGKNTNTTELPNDPAKVIKEIKEEPVVTPVVVVAADDTVVVPDAKGVKIDEELKAALEAGKTEITLDELKSVAPTAYNVIFDAYDNSGDNGIETTHYSLIETSEKKFTLKKL